MFVRSEPAHVAKHELGITRTPARASFKQNAGQNNHFLITVLVGLDSVHDGRASLKEEFSTSWSPSDIPRSALRSREYALVTSLAWMTDLVDVYRTKIQKMNSVFEASFSEKINAIDGRASRLSAVASTLNLSSTDPKLLMTLLAIKWRNAVVHSDTARRVGNQLKSDLRSKKTAISQVHRGLDIERTLESFESGQAPTFKEVASFISAAQGLVQSLDEAVVSQLKIDQYAETILCSYFSRTFGENNQIFSQYWAVNPQKSLQRLTSLLTQHGFTSAPTSSRLSSEYLDELISLSASTARGRFSPP